MEHLGTARPLEALRASIDAIDRDLLRLLSRRMAIVSEVADNKRGRSVPIRDLERERRILGERRDQAQELGLSPDMVESLFRRIMLASRDYQASLRAQVPVEMESQTVAILGGKGGMGQMLVRLFGDLGHAVLVVDTDTNMTSVQAAKAADVVVVSVPIDVTEEVIREVGPHLREDALLMDVTSLKGMPMEAMMAATKASVVGTHPMFGPGVHTLTGQRVLLCRGRGDGWFDWLHSVFSARGLVVSETDAATHDDAMAVVQVLNHFRTQVLGLALTKYGMSFEKSMEFTSPVYLLESYVTARHFAQSPDLYGPIEMLNPRWREVTGAFLEAAQELVGILDRGDRDAFRNVYENVREFFGDFTEEALEQSRFLVDRLIELTAGRAPTVVSPPASSTEKAGISGDRP